MQSHPSRRGLLAASGACLAVSIGGCLTDETEPDADNSCRETWNVVLYNESEDPTSIEVTIRDDDDRVAFSDTVEPEPGTDRFSGVELDVEVSYDRSYTFEAATPEGNELSEETVVNCGHVYIFVTESGELRLRDDEVDH